MKEKTNVKRRSHKRMIGFIIAAAVALTGAIGAYAYNQFVNRESVEYYLDDIEALEEKGYATNLVAENEHLRITVDTVLSDGVNAYVLVTKEALDDTGHDYLHGSNYFPLYAFRYADTGEYIKLQGGSVEQFSLDEYETGRSYTVYDISQIDIDREVEMIFYVLDTTKPIGELNEYYMPVDNTVSYDMVTLILDLSKNCKIKTLTSSEGTQIRLSQFEIICDDSDVTYTSYYSDSLHLIKKNGKYEELDGEKIHTLNYTDGSTTEPDYIIFGEFIDLDEYSGVEINGVEYLID